MIQFKYVISRNYNSSLFSYVAEFLDLPRHLTVETDQFVVTVDKLKETRDENEQRADDSLERYTVHAGIHKQ